MPAKFLMVLSMVFFSMLPAPHARLGGQTGSFFGIVPPKYELIALKGITGIGAGVPFIPSGVKRFGLTQKGVQSEIEKALRERGFKVYVTNHIPQEYFDQGSPQLIFEILFDPAIMGREFEKGPLAFHLRARLYQECVFPRLKEGAMFPTWEREMSRADDSADDLLKAIRMVADHFANDYKEANARKPKKSSRTRKLSFEG